MQKDTATVSLGLALATGAHFWALFLEMFLENAQANPGRKLTVILPNSEKFRA